MPLCHPHRGPARLGAWLLSHLLPAACAGCERRLGIDQRQGVCLACWEALEPRARPACDRCADSLPGAGGGPECERCRRSPPAFDWARALWTYSGPARGALLAYKYGTLPGLARPFAQAASEVAGARLAQAGAALVPVPLQPAKRRERGLDAARELAGELARRLRLDVVRALERRPSSVPQTGLGRSARQRNAAHSYRLARPEGVFGRRVVLVDDVLTTGATAHACARLLRGAGAREVGVLVLARASMR